MSDGELSYYLAIACLRLSLLAGRALPVEELLRLLPPGSGLPPQPPVE